MITLASRVLSTLALVAAVLWVAFPAVVMASADTAHRESEPCSCCEGQAALGGVIACPGCQVGTHAETLPPARALTVAIAWLRATSASVTGIDPAPAEPPPR